MTDYKQQAINCVNSYVLTAQKNQFEACGRDLDAFFNQESNEFYSYAVIVPGKEYELSYHNCTCGMVKAGLVNNPEHCECSRESIQYILDQFATGKSFTVELVESILRGDSRCRFKITVG